MKTFKVQAVANLLDVATDTVRRDAEEAGIEVQRQAGEGPRARIFTVENVFDLAAFRAKKTGFKAKKQIVITVYAPKGGVGKTTHTSNLMAIFALLGFRVLGVDLDMQGNLSMSYGYETELTDEEAREFGVPVESIVNYHLGHLLPLWDPNGQPVNFQKVLKKPLGENGPHLIPSEVTLDRLEALLSLDGMMGKNPDHAIAKFLMNGRTGKIPDCDLSQYDIIIFDAPPAKNPVTRSALLASDFVLAPVSMERYSTKSVSYLARVLGELKEDHKRCPEMLIFGNFFDVGRMRIAAQMHHITKNYPGALMTSHIATSEEFKKVGSTDDEIALPLAIARSTTASAAQLRAVAQELIQRTGIL